MTTQACLFGEAGSDSRDIVRGASFSLPGKHVRLHRHAARELRQHTNLSKVLPNFLLLGTLCFPLLANDFRDIRVIETWIATDDGLLVMLSVKDKRYKAVSSRSKLHRKQRVACFFVYK